MAVAVGLALVAGLAMAAMAHDWIAGGEPDSVAHSEPGSNAWNAGKAPADWHGEIERYHGHVGPWNVLGWRIGQAALREMKSEWGKHELEMVCYVPPQTPFTCLVDGLSVGTGNSQGRLDLRMAEVLTWEESFVAVRRKDGKGGVLEFRRSELLGVDHESAGGEAGGVVPGMREDAGGQAFHDETGWRVVPSARCGLRLNLEQQNGSGTIRGAGRGNG